MIEDEGQLIDHLARGCKPRSAWRIGTEHEKIAFHRRTLRPVPYHGPGGIGALLARLAEGGGWEPLYEGDHIVALSRGGASITLEPGGQIELSGAPLDSLFATCAEVHDHLARLEEVTRDLEIGFLGIGFQPKWRREEIDWMPKGRYRIMRAYMPGRGSLGLDMMLRTATVQANLDFSDEADMARKMRIATALQPLATALFAASPFRDGAPSGWRSTRAACWLDTDPDRTGIPPCVFQEHFGFADYVAWALDVPMYFVRRDGRYIDCSGASFRDFLAGRLAQLPGERPTIDDWADHLSTLFPEVRLKQFLEMRGADAGASNWICALPALWKGLLYDPLAMDEAWAMIADWSLAEVCDLRVRAPRDALAATFRGTTLQPLCRRMVEIARAGLDRIAEEAGRRSEACFLDPLSSALEEGATQADRMLALYHGAWRGRIEPAFDYCMH
ncbi:MAG: glutamate--cysteine ligase [Zetaproteobacteria bacterium]|nr:MAG: glutamate--cysteine ligase [Zetaproteobacteria bacterium]